MFFPVPTPGRGKIFIMPHPPAQEMNAIFADLRQQGATHVVSLMEPSEAKKIGLDQEEEACTEAGLAFLNYPVVDFGLPDKSEFQNLIFDLIQHLNTGAGLAVHCHAGIGRSGITVCCLLIAQGIAPDIAIQTVSTARGKPVPDTDGQTAFIRQFRLATIGQSSQ